jgi:hypothetical protein
MAVVIDDFEVVANEEENNQATGSSAVAGNAAGSPTVHDLETIVERQSDRYERVWAH